QARDDRVFTYPNGDALRGKEAFIDKGCIVCHSVNNIGGEIAPRLDTRFTHRNATNFLDFAARMWTYAPAMIEAQRATIGGQIDLTGQELADISAFALDEKAQKTLVDDDLTPEVRNLIKVANGY
ncbi:MAG: cytochrome c, partial [Rhodospirillales bacterium]|nr:cytochrome c [Rhodospirillales bacterium]